MTASAASWAVGGGTLKSDDANGEFVRVSINLDAILLTAQAARQMASFLLLAADAADKANEKAPEA